MPRRARGRPPHPDVLTPAEWAILDLWRHGLGRSAIARLKGISEYGVRYHVRNIADKLGVETAAELRHWSGVPISSPRHQQSHRRSHPMARLQLGPIGQVSMYARDASATEAWYRDVLRLPELYRFGDLVFFDMNGIRLYLHAVGDEKWRPSSVVYFIVDDITAAHEELTGRGIKFSGAPHLIYKDDQTGVEEWMAFFEDPDTNMLALMARVAPAA
jgi:DNA-binding CsgD family transcriptional regulator/catechol 2,3-dioxygenase-like lactoylglutathione lyase family enzyme